MESSQNNEKKTPGKKHREENIMLRAVFSDIDGTLVHYSPQLEKQGYELLLLPAPTSTGTTNNNSNNSNSEEPRIVCWRHKPTQQVVECLRVPSATLGGGFISIRTLVLINTLRKAGGVKFCVLTGARTSTFLARCQSGTLPFDYGVCEGGGKIFSGIDFSLDEDWISRFDAVTGRLQQQMPQEQRPGALWDLYRLLKYKKVTSSSSLNNGSDNIVLSDALLRPLKLDAESYDTAFMVDIRPPKSTAAATATIATAASSVLGVSTISAAESALRNLVEKNRQFRESLTVKINLGKAHITPKGCSKLEVMEYLCKCRLGIHLPPRKRRKHIAGEGADDDDEGVSCLATCSAFPTTSKAQQMIQMKTRNNLASRNSNSYNNNRQEEEASKKEAQQTQDIVAALFDDENDLEFADRCSVGYAIGVAHPAVSEFIEKKKREAAAEKNENEEEERLYKQTQKNREQECRPGDTACSLLFPPRHAARSSLLSSSSSSFAIVPVGGFLGTEFALQNLVDRFVVFEKKSAKL